jgi:hypothetical protein
MSAGSKAVIQPTSAMYQKWIFGDENGKSLALILFKPRGYIPPGARVAAKLVQSRALVRRDDQRPECEAQTDGAQTVKEREMNPICSRRSVPQSSPNSECHIVRSDSGEASGRN